MSPSKEIVLETPTKELSHRITVSSAKRGAVEADEQVADGGGVGGMPSKPLPYGWYSDGGGEKTLKKVAAATGRVDAKTVRMRERWMLRYFNKEGQWPSLKHAH